MKKNSDNNDVMVVLNEEDRAESTAHQLALDILDSGELYDRNESRKVFGQFATYEPPREMIRSADPISDFFITHAADDAGPDKLLPVKPRKDMRASSISTKASLFFDSDVIRTSKPLSLFEREVYDAALILYANNPDCVFTPQMIFEMLYGNTDSDYNKNPGIGKKKRRIASDNMLREIDEALTYCMSGIMTLELSTVDTKYGAYERNTSGAILPLKRAMVYMQNKHASSSVYCVAFRFASMPLLYPFLLSAGAYLKTPLIFNALPADISFTKYNIATRSILSYALTYAIADKKPEVYVPYSKIYDVRNAKESKQKARSRKLTLSILAFWKDNGFIADFSERKRGATTRGVAMTGIDIVLEPCLFDVYRGISDKDASEEE